MQSTEIILLAQMIGKVVGICFSIAILFFLIFCLIGGFRKKSEDVVRSAIRKSTAIISPAIR